MKNFLTILFVAYVLSGIGGFVDLGRMNYYDVDSFDHYVKAYITIRIAVAVFFAWIYLKCYIKYAPEKYEKYRNSNLFRILVPFVMFLSFLILNTGFLLPWNHLAGETDRINIAGVVMNKNIQYGAKSRRTYFLSINDTVANKNYYFDVRKGIYKHFHQDDVFIKEMKMGKLGILYREEE